MLDIRSRQMSLVKPKQGVIGPGEALDDHRPSLRVGLNHLVS